MLGFKADDSEVGVSLGVWKLAGGYHGHVPLDVYIAVRLWDWCL